MLIQLGAILAVVVVYFARLWRVLIALPSDPDARRFVLSIVVAFLPAAVVGLALHDFIKNVLFNSPALICVVLIVGGVALAALDRYDIDARAARRHALPAGRRVRHRNLPVPCDRPRRVALRGDNRRRAADEMRQARGRGILLLPRDTDDARGVRARLLQEPRGALTAATSG